MKKSPDYYKDKVRDAINEAKENLDTADLIDFFWDLHEESMAFSKDMIERKYDHS